MRKQNNNIFSPANIEPETDYYWRVDALSGKDVRKGKVGSFSLTK